MAFQTLGQVQPWYNFVAYSQCQSDRQLEWIMCLLTPGLGWAHNSPAFMSMNCTLQMQVKSSRQKK